ncbi:APC family permease [Streptomyces sp. BH097]|uniref:APC family permease n=1 Tax=unclassified Streptomyces TaxID=2593676 RepID=UPI003BB4EA16
MTSKDVVLSGRLGVGAIIFMVVAAAAPLSVVAALTPIGILQGNGEGFPALFLVITAVMLAFSVGFTTLTPRVADSGGFSSYIRAGFGVPAGTGATFLATATYIAMQVGMYAYMGLLISDFLTGQGIPLPWWAVTLLLIAFVGYLGYRNIDFSAKVLGALLVAELVVITIVSFAIIGHGGQEGISLNSFEPSRVFDGNIGLGLTFAVSAFLGFESTAVYRDEARDPDRTIPRATFGAVIGVGVVYAFASWALVQGWGGKVADVAAASFQAGDMYQRTAERYVGTWLGLAVSVLLVTSLFACILSFHNVASRYLFTNAHGGTLPSLLGRQNLRHRSPATASIVETVVITVLLILLVVLGLDPYADIYTWFAAVGVVGILLLMVVTSAAVVRYFAVAGPEAKGVGVWRRLFAPGLSGAALLVIFLLVVTNFPVLVGEVDAHGRPSAGPVSATILGTVCGCGVLGIGWGVRVQRKRSSTPRAEEVRTTESAPAVPDKAVA